MNGTIISKRGTEKAAEAFHGFSRCGQGVWTNGTVTLTPTRENGVRVYAAHYNATGISSGTWDSLAAAVSYYR